ncbi:MAG: MoaD/ThiS family protein [Planctomycetota bacterium]
MQLNVLLFAGAKEAAGSDHVTIHTHGEPTASEVLKALEQQHPALSDLLPSCRLAVGNNYVDSDHTVTANDELALIPPVSGG